MKTPLHHHFQDGIFRGKNSPEPCARCILEHAAPELLEALKKIVAWHDCFPPTSGEADLPIISQARAAIAQAEGRGK